MAGLGQALIAKYNTLRIECGKRLTNLHAVVDIGNGRATGSMDREGARERERRERENIWVRVRECLCGLVGLGQAHIAKYNTLRIECG